MTCGRVEVPRLESVGRLLCSFGAALGALGLLGWLFDARSLTTVVPGQPPMMPNAGAALLMAGVAGALQKRGGRAPFVRLLASRLAAMVVLAIGAGTLAEYGFGVDLHIDQLLFRADGAPHPGRPSPWTALALVCLGAAIPTLDVRAGARARPSEALIFGAALIALTALVGQSYGAGALYRLGRSSVIGVALPTAVSLMSTAMGLLLQRPTMGVMGVATSRGPGGVLVRRLVPATLAGPAVIVRLLVWFFGPTGGTDLPLMAATFAVAMSFSGVFLIFLTAGPLERSHEALASSQERFELALRGADLGTWDWNIRTGEVIFNARWAEIRGLDPERVKPHVETWISGVHPDDRASVEQTLADYLEGRTVEYETEHRVLTSTGEWRWILDRGKVFERDERGRPLRMVGTELDIADRKRFEAEQRFLAELGAVLASTLEYEDTLEHVARLAVHELADLCIVGIVADGGEIRRLKVVSRDPSKAWISELIAATTPLDRARPHLVRSVLETKGSVLMARLSTDAVASLAHGEEHLRALRALDPRSFIGVPLLIHDKLVGAIALVSSTPSRVYGPRDVRFAEEIARRAALAIENARLYRAAQRAIAARDDVLGVVAHDLRNPLGTILMQASLLRIREVAPERLRRAADVVERAATRMNRLIEDLLDVTRMEAGRLGVERTPVTPARIVHDSVDSQAPLAAASDIALSAEVPEELPEISADRDRLLQVFENLIGNALKFTKPAGRITIGAAARRGEVLFWVADTGAGVSAEHLPHLFDRFWQARSGDRLGAGLGLPIVKGIVEAHGGRIWVESTPGRGSTFFFTIPTEAPALVSESEPARPHEGAERCVGPSGADVSSTSRGAA